MVCKRFISFFANFVRCMSINAIERVDRHLGIADESDGSRSGRPSRVVL